MVTFSKQVLAAVAFATSAANGLAIRQQTPPLYLTLPPTPDLPSPISTTTTLINGANLWMQKYNEAVGSTPIVIDHGGLGYSAYFGAVISRLVGAGHYVIAIDRRGHGRSTFNAGDMFTYDMFASDIHAQLTAAGVQKSVVVGWSDGAITTLAALMNATIAPTIEKAFLFGASALPSDTNATFPDTKIFAEFVARCRAEYATLQPGANFTAFATKVAVMEATLPQFGEAELARIDGTKVTIADADEEEAVNRDVPARLVRSIKGSGSVTLKGVSHFAPVQDPEQFFRALEDWLKAL